MHEAMKHGTIIRREPERATRASAALAFVVIVARMDEPHLPFVVWYQSVGVAGADASYWSGEYCANLTEACAEFQRRTGVEA